MHQNRVSIAELLWSLKGAICLDVRAPSEFASGHIPGAINLPLFSDAERARVGTAYKVQSPKAAFELGLLYAGPKMVELVRAARRLVAGQPLYLYCWRGGQRSAAMAWLLAQAGMEVYVLEGGYKSWRTYAHSLLEQPWKLRLLGGKTGSGKTELLHHLGIRGAQIVDLEALANHKGSAFGAFNQPTQVNHEHFMNLIAARFHGLDVGKPVWLEDESRMIGQLAIPDALFRKMQKAPLYVLEVPLELRLTRLLAEYGGIEQHILKQGFERIARKLGGLQLKLALEALEQGDLTTAAGIALRYYDRAYDNDLAERQIVWRRELAVGSLSMKDLAGHLLQMDIDNNERI